jgi:SAM-dependent methyltransferase
VTERLEHSGFAERKLLGILSATWLAQAVYVATKLAVPDLLADGPRTTGDLAAASGADPTALRRVLDTLAAAGVLRAAGDDSYSLSSVSELLRTGAPGGGREIALLQGNEVFRSFAEIEYTVRSGRPAFEKVFGQPFYDYLATDPEVASAFHGPMAAQPPPAHLSDVDLTTARTLIDLGGGTGALLAEALDANPHLRGVLVELPTAAAVARERLAPYGDRVQVLAGDIFAAVPVGADVYTLCRVLHNWPDDACIDLLTRIRAVIAPAGRVLVLERQLDPAGPGTLATRLADLLMLVTTTGRDRTTAEYGGLLAAAGFAVTTNRPGLIEATAS